MSGDEVVGGRSERATEIELESEGRCGMRMNGQEGGMVRERARRGGGKGQRSQRGEGVRRVDRILF